MEILLNNCDVLGVHVFQHSQDIFIGTPVEWLQMCYICQPLATCPGRTLEQAPALLQPFVGG